jgi:uncharacterized membrane protein
MFQEWLFVALKLLVVACLVAVVVAVLLMRAACARLVAQSAGSAPLPTVKGTTRTESRLVQRGV